MNRKTTSEQLLEAFIEAAQDAHLLSPQDTREVLLVVMRDEGQFSNVREAAKELRFFLLKEQS